MANNKPPPSSGSLNSQPLIPERFIDVPSQRLYFLSLGLLLQAIKLFDFLQYLLTTLPTSYYGRKWLFADFLYIVTLSQLRIPRLRYSAAIVLLQLLLFWFFDGLLFGGVSVNLGLRNAERAVSPMYSTQFDPSSSSEAFSLLNFFAQFSIGWTSSEGGHKDTHLQGQHTVRMSPISTAQLNPDGNTFCLLPPSNAVLIPILVNNTNPSSVRYSLTPLGYSDNLPGVGKIEYVELTAKDLRAIEQSRIDHLQLIRVAGSSKREGEEYDEYDDDEYDDEEPESSMHSQLQKTQSLIHIRITKPGTLRLERVTDDSGVTARFTHSMEVVIAHCPSAQFSDDTLTTNGADIRCAGDETDLQLKIDISGVPPLSLRWAKIVNGKTEYSLVEGIESGRDEHHVIDSEVMHHEVARRRTRTSENLQVPLTVSLGSLGKHTYILEDIIDGVGNTVHLDSGSLSVSDSHRRLATHPMSKIVRSVTLFRRPSVAFKQCGPGHPASLLIGSETPLTISTRDLDPEEIALEVAVQYQSDTTGTTFFSKKQQSWVKRLTMQQGDKELTFTANAPGQYKIIGVQGRCEGDVLAPETCDVVEKPKPTAEIEWRKIHECSGDTGVSASLVLHGTPPFQVYYRTQRDQEHPRDLVQTFNSARGEITLQPERSGHYVYTFVQLSDANYRKVDIDGPSIDQVVHPLAAAEFAHASSSGGTKRTVNSCAGNTADIEIDLRGTAPWNLEVQVVGLANTETLKFTDIATTPTKLQIPIPSKIDKEGGSFEIDLVSVEDSYGCKRSLSVPGISVNVRRVKPTAKFYGKIGHREVTVLEREPATLPLRLTGDAPWRITYRRREEPERRQTVTVHDPNDHIQVTENGIYEIVEVSDSQCPGLILPGEDMYVVHWIPRPSAKLAAQTVSAYEPFNRSHILPPICQGVDDHVDLELTGRAPFQIMYNVARNDEAGGTTLLDQPTFNSIQPRTRFQLHTSSVGRMYYEVKQIGDAAYPLAKHKNAIVPRSERLLFEQEVLTRASARFKSDARLSYCLDSEFVPGDRFSTDGLIQFEGSAPFRLTLSIKNLATTESYTETLETHERSWRINLPSYRFHSIGPHLVTIESIHDSSPCEQATLDPLARSIWVDVAETATIIPFDKREDICVGDVTRFQLEGNPPWSIGYRVNGKSSMQEAKISPFSFVQKQAGDFAIASVAHQQKMCKAVVTDLHYNVHPLPSAQVGNGKRIYQDIHEGDQAEILFTLMGEPPFTFTYQRAEPSTKKGGRPGKVLETHTVSGVTTKEYSIFSALEGTWTVTSISDRYCRYPPAQPEGAQERIKP